MAAAYSASVAVFAPLQRSDMPKARSVEDKRRRYGAPLSALAIFRHAITPPRFSLTVMSHGQAQICFAAAAFVIFISAATHFRRVYARCAPAMLIFATPITPLRQPIFIAFLRRRMASIRHAIAD
jgi:hypothetical protein